MSKLSVMLGTRIRSYRKKLGLSQEKLAELSGCHATYIGQLERGEKNATLESVEKITVALGIPFSELFDKLEGLECENENFPLKCYDLIMEKSTQEQEQLYLILKNIVNFKDND